MSFVVSAFGLTGMAATLAAGAAYGGMTTVGMNLVRGKGAFDNIGQGILLGGAGAGIISGLGAAASQAGTAAPVIDGTLAGAAEVANTGAMTAAEELALAETSSLGGKGAVAGLETAAAAPAAQPATSPYSLFDGAPRPGGEYNPASPATGNGLGLRNASSNFGLQPPSVSPTSTPSPFSTAKPPAPEFLKDPVGWIKDNPRKSGIGAYAAYNMLNKPPPAEKAPTPGGDRYDYAYKPAQYGPDGRVVSPASYGTPTVTHYAAAGGSIPGFADGVYIPQSKSIRTNIYGSNAGPIGESGRQMYKNTDKYAGLKAQLDKMSPTMLSKLSQGGTDSIVQAAATTELYDRANTANSSYMDQPTMQAAQGGIMGMADGGYTSSATAQDAPQYQYNPANQTYAQQAAAPQGSDGTFGALSGMFEGGGFLDQIKRAGILGPTDAKAKQYSYDPKGQSYAQNMAAGGIASLPNEYAAGGKLLQGPGDGMSDSIPAVIKGARPQRAALAQGEFVIPADVVSHLGNGSTDAGAKRLYAMMDKIRHARTGTKKQGRQINPANFMPA